MTTDLAALRPSPTGPIPLEALTELPLRMPLVLCDEIGYRTIRFTSRSRWGGSRPNHDFYSNGWTPYQHGVDWENLLNDGLELHWPKLPHVLFRETGVALGGRVAPYFEDRAGTRDHILECDPPGKVVTRRKPRTLYGPGAGESRLAPPQWAKPGHLFLAVDRKRQKGWRGLMVGRVESAEIVGRYRCRNCDGSPEKIINPTDEHLKYGYEIACPACGWEGSTYTRDTLSPDELAREGRPGADPDEFWAELVRMSAAVDGKTCRVKFSRV